jgi:hypothetical protein
MGIQSRIFHRWRASRGPEGTKSRGMTTDRLDDPSFLNARSSLPPQLSR